MIATQVMRQCVVLLPFPFSDLSASKLRPALVLASAGRGDWLLCQITSKVYGDARAVELGDADFANGGLKMVSQARPAKLFTAHESLIRSVVGQLSIQAHGRVCAAVVAVVNDQAIPAQGSAGA